MSEEAVKSERMKELLGALMLIADPNIVIKKIEAFLRILGIRYLLDPEEMRIIVPMVVEGHEHTVVIALRGAWIITKAKILNASKFPEQVKLELFKTLLMANARIPECTYGIEEDESVTVTESILITALDFEGFAEEFLSMAGAIAHFWREIWPQIKQRLDEIAEKEARMTYT